MATESTHRIRGTRPDLGQQLRQEWLNARDVECEPLTFGDLKKGDKFICMPTPGDNSGHGGLLDESYLFMKTDLVGDKFPTNTIRLMDGTLTRDPDSMWVLKIE